MSRRAKIWIQAVWFWNWALNCRFSSLYSPKHPRFSQPLREGVMAEICLRFTKVRPQPSGPKPLASWSGLCSLFYPLLNPKEPTFALCHRVPVSQFGNHLGPPHGGTRAPANQRTPSSFVDQRRRPALPSLGGAGATSGLGKPALRPTSSPSRAGDRTGSEEGKESLALKEPVGRLRSIFGK